MVRNRATNDEDFVLSTQYPKLSRRMKKNHDLRLNYRLT